MTSYIDTEILVCNPQVFLFFLFHILYGTRGRVGTIGTIKGAYQRTATGEQIIEKKKSSRIKLYYCWFFFLLLLFFIVTVQRLDSNSDIGCYMIPGKKKKIRDSRQCNLIILLICPYIQLWNGPRVYRICTRCTFCQSKQVRGRDSIRQKIQRRNN